MSYARITNGIVAELFTLPAGSPPIAEMFHPSLTWVDVTNVSPAPQAGWSYSGGSFAPPPAPPAPTLAEQAAAMLAVGCTISSTGTPTLNGTYACTPDGQNKISATALYCQINGKFPGGKTTMVWADAAGAPHTFPTTASFLAFATAIGDFVAALDEVMLGQATALPAQPATIP